MLLRHVFNDQGDMDPWRQAVVAGLTCDHPLTCVYVPAEKVQ